MSKGGYADQDKITAERREKKAKKALSAGKSKKEEIKSFSMAREDRYVRPVANLANVSSIFPTTENKEVTFSFYAAKPQQVGRDRSEQYMDSVPLLLQENVTNEWVVRHWPSLCDVVKLMQVGDIQHFEREIQNTERIWKTTLFVKRVS